MIKILLTAVLLMLASPAMAADYTVRMISATPTDPAYRFEPGRLVVHPGDTVHFIEMQDDTHDVMFEQAPPGVDLAMSPMLMKKGQSWSYTFKQPGLYKYHCHPHEAMGMQGTIIVDKS